MLVRVVRIFFSRLHFPSISPSLWDGWMDDLCFYILSKRISVMPGRWVGDGRLCAMESWLRWKRSPPKARLESVAALPAGQRLAYWATGAPLSIGIDDSIQTEILSERAVKPLNNLTTNCSSARYKIASHKSTTSLKSKWNYWKCEFLLFMYHFSIQRG